MFQAEDILSMCILSHGPGGLFCDLDHVPGQAYVLGHVASKRVALG